MKKPDDIAALDKKIEQFKQKEMEKQNDAQNKPEYSYVAAGFQISTELLSGIVIGASIGYLLDKIFNISPWMFAIFTIFGGAAGALSIYKTFRADDKDSKE